MEQLSSYIYAISEFFDNVRGYIVKSVIQQPIVLLALERLNALHEATCEFLGFEKGNIQAIKIIYSSEKNIHKIAQDKLKTEGLNPSPQRDVKSPMFGSSRDANLTNLTDPTPITEDVINPDLSIEKLAQIVELRQTIESLNSTISDHDQYFQLIVDEIQKKREKKMVVSPTESTIYCYFPPIQPDNITEFDIDSSPPEDTYFGYDVPALPNDIAEFESDFCTDINLLNDHVKKRESHIFELEITKQELNSIYDEYDKLESTVNNEEEIIFPEDYSQAPSLQASSVINLEKTAKRRSLRLNPEQAVNSDSKQKSDCTKRFTPNSYKERIKKREKNRADAEERARNIQCGGELPKEREKRIVPPEFNLNRDIKLSENSEGQEETLHFIDTNSEGQEKTLPFNDTNSNETDSYSPFKMSVSATERKKTKKRPMNVTLTV
jgi:hypothetical protein